MNQPIVAVHFTLADGSCRIFEADEMEPGAHYSISRNFNSPSRKRLPGKPKDLEETWIQHDIHFVTDREPKANWEQRSTRG